MEKIFQNSVPVIPLSDLVNNFCIEQNNMERRHYIKTLTHAKWVCKELFRRSIWEIKQMVLPVIDGKIHLPEDVEQLINISVIDHHGNLHPLGFNPNINTLEILCSNSGCSCGCGGKDTLCAYVDNLTLSTEPIVINSVTYYKYTWLKKCGNGDLVEYSKIPAWKAASSSVVTIESQKTLCTLDVTSKGCIKPTDSNRNQLNLYCGCYYSTIHDRIWEHCHNNVDIEATSSDYGYWNWNATSKDIIHIKDSKATKFIVSYQSSIDKSDAELLIPEYAIDAVQIGIMYRQAMFNPRGNMNDKKGAKSFFMDAKLTLNKYLRPIRIDTLSKLQTRIPKW